MSMYNSLLQYVLCVCVCVCVWGGGGGGIVLTGDRVGFSGGS